eukprot:1186511-Prorocentrum_minimum.AAC.3
MSHLHGTAERGRPQHHHVEAPRVARRLHASPHTHHRVDGKGYTVDAKGYTVDGKGYSVDAKGYTVDGKGYRADAKGYTVDVKGYIEYCGY